MISPEKHQTGTGCVQEPLIKNGEIFHTLSTLTVNLAGIKSRLKINLAFYND